MSNERLRGAIASAGMTTEQLAAQVGVDPKTVQRWITKGRVPHRRHRAAAATLLSTRDSYLWPSTADDPTTRSASHAELVDFYPSRAAVPAHLWQALLRDCTDSVDFLAYAGLYLPEHLDAIPQLERLARSGVRVRIALGDPHAPAVALRGAEEGLDDGMAHRIQLSLRYYESIRHVPGLTLRIHDTTLYGTILRSDDTMLVNTHVYGAPAAQSPVLHLHRVPGGRVFDHYLRSFERVWGRSIAWQRR
ncbi:MAG: helix-turn-helix domain-containing protein [Actinobacteria bacterium]|nr:helix-turn-helix domain-containing protein [Actinomycetota bacterium]